ncbi:MAG: DUF58 domain-containing protein [Bacteroidales bacterium]|nr:DUF58 domain-containing protein [Bacteroidales bacterium]
MPFLKSLYLRKPFFIVLMGSIFLYIAGTWLPWLAVLANVTLLTTGAVFLLEIILLYTTKNGVEAQREIPELFSNGDKNIIRVHLSNRYWFPVHLNIIDEIPAIFQIRDFSIRCAVKPFSERVEKYHLVPVKRGEFEYGYLNLFAGTIFRLVERRFKFHQPDKIKVYPSFQQIKNIDFYSFARMKNLFGTKRVRRAGHNREFEQIKDYVPGDEPRHINWKATARKNKLMVNEFQQEKSQNVYSLIDMGRGMEMAFEGMTMLDYAINATLALGRVVLKNSDRFGMLSYSNYVHQYLPAESRNNQFTMLMEGLYKQQTDFRESSLESVLGITRKQINTRSLLIIFTNYMSRYAIEREMDYLKSLAARHLVLMITFEDTKIRELLSQKAYKLQDVYVKTVAESFMYEKKQILNELSYYGIHHIITPPASLTGNTINKYLEIKARGVL